MTETSKKTPSSGTKAARLGQSAVIASGAERAKGSGAERGDGSGAARAKGNGQETAAANDANGGLQAFVEANEAIMSSMAALSSEMMSFGSERLRAHMERSETLAACDDLTQAFRVQMDFMDAAAKQYLSQTNNVLGIMTTMTRSFWTPWPMPGMTEQSSSDEKSE